VIKKYNTTNNQTYHDNNLRMEQVSQTKLFNKLHEESNQPTVHAGPACTGCPQCPRCNRSRRVPQTRVLRCSTHSFGVDPSKFPLPPFPSQNRDRQTSLASDYYYYSCRELGLTHLVRLLACLQPVHLDLIPASSRVEHVCLFFLF
jgi:hypothetical protein